MFVENTEGGELRSRMKEVIKNLETNLGFTIRVVERNGSSLRSKFPLTNLWEGSMCGRQDCTTCSPNVTRHWSSMKMYAVNVTKEQGARSISRKSRRAVCDTWCEDDKTEYIITVRAKSRLCDTITQT